MRSASLICDGCGQTASPEHIARRLKRLEMMTRFRPVHVQALLLGAVSPVSDADHLYSAQGEFQGEATELFDGLAIESQGRSVEATLAEFQRRGFLLTYVLECPSELGDADQLKEAITRRLGATAARIRRSFKPKKVYLLGEELDPFVSLFRAEDLGAELAVHEAGRAFRVSELRNICSVTAVTATGAAPL